MQHAQGQHGARREPRTLPHHPNPFPNPTTGLIHPFPNPTTGLIHPCIPAPPPQGLGKTEGELERIVFEATGPKGVAILVETLTDKRTRTLTLLRTLLHRHGCVLFLLSAVLVAPFSRLLTTQRRPPHVLADVSWAPPAPSLGCSSTKVRARGAWEWGPVAKRRRAPRLFFLTLNPVHCAPRGQAC